MTLLSLGCLLEGIACRYNHTVGLGFNIGIGGGGGVCA